MEVAYGMTDVDTIGEMIGIVEGSMDGALLSALSLVHEYHAFVLLEDGGYRDSFVDHPRLAVLHIDDLLAKVKDDGEGDSKRSIGNNVRPVSARWRRSS